MGGILIAFVLAWAAPVSFARAETPFDPSVRPNFSEPVVLASKDGVLEVRLIAKQGEARLDTVATPVKNMLVFAYELIRGTASNGQMSGDNLYPSPTLQVFPGRDADRPSRQRAHRPHHPGFLRSAIYGEGRGGAALSRR